MDRSQWHSLFHRLDDGYRRPPPGKEANVFKWLWSIVWGTKRRRNSRRPSSLLWTLFRWFTPGFSIVGVIGALVAALTGQINLPSIDALRGNEAPVFEDPIAATVASSTSPLQPAGFATSRSGIERTTGSNIVPVALTRPSAANASGKSQSTIRIATFNIKVFGEAKSSDADVMQQLAAVFRQFDVIAVQEIRGDPNVPIDRLLAEITRQGSRYRAKIGPPLGRTSQTECYGFVWDQDRIDFINDSAYIVQDGNPKDRMHREPMVASFQTRVAPVDSRLPFRFTLINVHTDPDEVKGNSPENELNVLDDVFQSVRDFEYETTGEEDFILLGDLNVNVKGLRELGAIPGMVSLVGDVPTNTLKTETYDHLLLDSRVTTEYARRSGVLDLEQMFGIDRAAAGKISDHLPVWAEFSVYESPRSR